MSWTDDAAAFLLDAAACPRCLTRTWGGESAIRNGVCARCGADLSGEAGTRLWAASEAAVTALRQRQSLVEALPTAQPVAPVPAAAPAGAYPPVPQAPVAAPTGVYASAPAEYGAPTSAPVPPPAAPRSTVSLQSVLAVAGAGLLAVAAIVFTFLNPDLTDHTTRTTIIAVVTAVFLGGAWLLHARGLRFSAEAVGALGMVFLALDVWAFSRVAPEGTSAWFFGALALLVSGGAMVAIGARMRMRSWTWSGLVGLAIAPAFVGYGVEEQLGSASSGWPATWGHVTVVFAGWLLLELVRALSRRMGGRMLADTVALTVLQFAAAATAVPLAFMLDTPYGVARELPIAAVIAALSIAALLTTRRFIPAVWSVVGGLLASWALVLVALAIPLERDEWLVVLMAAAITVPLLVVATVRRMGSVHRTALALSVLSAAALAVIPIAGALVARGLGTLAATWAGFGGVEDDLHRASWALASVIGLLLIAGGVWALSRRTARPVAALWLDALARWVGVVAVAGIPLAIPGPIELPIAVALALAIAAALALLFVPRLRDERLALRAPLVTVAYGMIAEAVLLSWPEAATAAVTGAVAVAALALAARTAPPAIRPLHTALGFGYALVAGAAALTLTDLEVLPILCLVTTGAALIAIASSLGGWLPVGSWYAVLGVTAVPFGIGIVSVLIERSGWTALSTGVILLLAATLVLTRRSGSSTLLRAGGAALLVPTLAVVVVCLTAEFLTASGSPYALPIIAVIVACALPTTGLVREALMRRGYGEGAADAVRLAIEVSSLVTGAIAVVLALVRVAAGVEIAFVVLLVLGLGAAATALWMRRRYGWWTAAAAWTGALWCAWSLIGVTVVEPYLLPPATAAMIVGATLVARRRSGEGSRPAAALFATGLGVAVVPAVALLAITGNGTGTSFDPEPVLWRSGALMAAGVVLTILAGLVTRKPDAAPTRFEDIRMPLLLGAVIAASAGAVQGIRLGWERDPLPLADVHPVLQALALGVVAAATAGAAAQLAQLAGARSRWLYAPVTVFLVLGPMAAISADPVAIWTVWSLELLLLLALIATVWRARGRTPAFPPVWFQWSLAWVVAVVAWSPREILRVEGFSLPLGIALVIAGVIVLVRGTGDGERGSFASWPVGFRGSWSLLGPGIVATLLPSVIATFTSPDTWRAILVIALALVAVLAGARKTLAAPFILGIATLPLEILVVFLVQIGETINPLLWWIALATAGIVLLVIAVGWERRTGADASLVARMRDLR